ncbi:hypothetical protein MPTK1_7g16570 [Marchantia polymorpha subsp. ruderalis]|uniref:DUF247 domain-containing protein n=2 Tax=Marchantia polymorpha TaxID=3197 RepID=A0AAF6C0E5_MARPO|nr:hypothetical protein MARPO_0123s0040 [Marchantia polymorpha]BBN17729.1 hypothetical protein Mp_7g16570 [Marchantia polymorpha subsp. ruderalis]|eukprot:PTQ30553.1 hypothetical protein MARPO_0123s0040 [Marchantia polymorpha]
MGLDFQGESSSSSGYMMASRKQKMEHVLHLERIDLMDELMAKMKRARSTANPTIFRPSTRSNHSEQYSPTYISLGLYNKDIQVKESTTIDRYKLEIKLEMAVVFQETVKKSWTEICQLVVESPEDMKNIYDDCPIDDPQAVRNILTLDAVFVTCILHTLWDVHGSEGHSVQPRFAEIAEVVQDRGLRKSSSGVMLDILAIFQNQIPLQLITRVVEIMYQSRPMEGSKEAQSSSSLYFPADPNSVTLEIEELPLNSVESKPSTAVRVLSGIAEVVCGLMRYVLPGPSDHYDRAPPIQTADYSHLLECVYWGALQHNTWEWPEEKDATHPIATATQLQKAGISIVRGSGSINDVRFKRGIFTATLIVPQLRITPWTETILRNLLEFESRVLKKGDLMCYLSFMDQLIDTEEDVLLLKERKLSVIELSLLSSDIDVANIFNSLLHSSNDVPISKQWATLRKDIHSFYNNDKRQLWVEFVQIYFGRPWFTASVVAAFALLVLTFLQTFYTVKAYNKSGSPATS